MSKNAIWKNFDHTYGPLPIKATEYLKLQKEMEKLEYNVKQKKAFNELLGDRGVMDARDRTTIVQKRNQMQVLRTELLNHRHMYRNVDHMNAVLQYVFPDEFVQIGRAHV